MFVPSIFFLITYLVCSIQIRHAINFKIPHNLVGKSSIRVIKFFRHFYPKFSFKLFFEVLDYVKCPIFVILSAVIFNNKQITDATAFFSYAAHYFPIWSYFQNNSRNFTGIILTGFILDPITGSSMLFAYLLSAKSFGYTSIATTSSMMVGIAKTIIHIVFFDNTDYVEAVFFIFFGVLAIYKNKRALICVCEKSVKKDINLYKFGFKKKNDNKSNKNEFKNDNKDIKKYKKVFKKSDMYRNYKKFYKNNQKFKESDRRYEDKF